MELITASLYRPIFYGVMTIIACFVYAKCFISDEGNYKESHIEFIVALVLALFFTFFFGYRPLDLQNFGSEFGDSYGMALEYNLRRLYQKYFIWDWDSQNFIFDNLYNFFAFHDYSYSQFFTIIAAIYLFSILWACKRFFSNYLLFCFVTCLFSYVTFGNLVNGFKAGAASALFILAMSFREKNFIISIVLAILAWGFHHAFHLCIYAFLAAHILRYPKLNFCLWCICVIIAALHITYFQEIFSEYTDEAGSSYLTIESQREDGQGYYTGFRFDFLIYSLMPMLIGYVSIVKKNINDENYKFLLNFYIITNSIWVLCMYASFTNRIAALSWFLYPVLLLYPFLRCDWGNNRFRVLVPICVFQMVFTMFMTFVY